MPQRSSRFEKLDWLLENCTEKFITDCTFLTELVGWMSEDEFDAFHENICRNWDITSPFAEVDDSNEDLNYLKRNFNIQKA